MIKRRLPRALILAGAFAGLWGEVEAHEEDGAYIRVRGQNQAQRFFDGDYLEPDLQLADVKFRTYLAIEPLHPEIKYGDLTNGDPILLTRELSLEELWSVVSSLVGTAHQLTEKDGFKPAVDQAMEALLNGVRRLTEDEQ